MDESGRPLASLVAEIRIVDAPVSLRHVGEDVATAGFVRLSTVTIV
jgi:hypothetical protein